MDISAIVLNKILSEPDLEAWSRLKSAYLDPSYTSVFAAISRHYAKYSMVPSFVDLEIVVREGQTRNTLEAVKLTECPDVSIEVAIDALIDQYTQNETIKALDKFVDKLPTLDTLEVKENLAAIVLMLDEKTISNENVHDMTTLMAFQHDEEISANRVMLGFNNAFDSVLGGMSLQEFLLIGGKRGAGKSIVAANIAAMQYEDGNSVVYFSIEMTGQETFQRILSILAKVNHSDLKKNKLSPEDILKVVKVRAGMFVDADNLVQEFCEHKDRFKFEETLVRTKQLKPDNQIVIVDDRDLTLTSIDIHLGKLKAKFGDKLKVSVVDYINQVAIEGNNGGAFDWQPQVEVSKQMKNLARKYNLLNISPYQIDDNGQTRFAKGILDAADVALLLEAHDKSTNAITFATTKIRGDRELEITSSMNWDTLRINPVSIEKPAKGAAKEEPKAGAIKKKATGKVAKTDDPNADVPWD